jgi:hypothetical protein
VEQLFTSNSTKVLLLAGLLHYSMPEGHLRAWSSFGKKVIQNTAFPFAVAANPSPPKSGYFTVNS